MTSKSLFSSLSVEAIVEFDYQAQHDDELTIAVGDIVSNIRKNEGGWWEGELDGRRGLFPDNFVRVKKESSLAGSKSDLSNGEAFRKRRCKAVFSYAPQNEDELELKIGDVIEVLGEVEEGWWEGTLSGKTGMFPSNFTKELLAEDTVCMNVQRESSPYSLPVTIATVTKVILKMATSIKLMSYKFLTRQESNRGANSSIKSSLTDSSFYTKELCKVIFPYEAQNEDELSIKEGDIVTVINKDSADTGWWLGELNGKQGVFPDNFVKLFIPEVEKEVRSSYKKTEAKRVPPERPESLPHRAEEKGEESKLGEIAKPSFPAALPKKPLPPKNNNSLNRPLSLPPKRPDRPERPAVPNIPSVSHTNTHESASLILDHGTHTFSFSFLNGLVWNQIKQLLCNE
uniref:Osteoclast-stimulating factor 1 n=1 Tax=Sinocyclocheilus grahami TaxID=75366 RepID=A0A672Q368_SINGR